MTNEFKWLVVVLFVQANRGAFAGLLVNPLTSSQGPLAKLVCDCVLGQKLLRGGCPGHLFP